MAIDVFGNAAGGGPALKPLSFSVHPKVYENVARCAATRNVRAAEYARQLFEAAYAVRCVQDRGERHDDGELDMQVRLVFLMADCEPDYIASALAVSEATVARIIEGWRRIAGELEQPKAPAGGAAASAKGTRWTDADRLTLKQMWANGKSVAEIAAALGRTVATVQQYAITHRGLCPKRR